MFKRSCLLSLILILAVVNTQAQERKYTRLKGYYRVYQSTNSMLSYFIDGMMEFYIPVSDTADEASEGKKGSPLLNGSSLVSVAVRLRKPMVMIPLHAFHYLIWNGRRSLRVLTVRNTPLVTMEMCTDGLINAVR